MKRAIMCFIGAMMVFSLAACTPTTEKNKTGEVKQTEAAQAPKSTQGPGVVTDKNPDMDAPQLEVVSIYAPSEDGSKMNVKMESVETLDAQSLVDLLIQYKVLEDGTKAVSYKTEGTVASEEVGPGIAKPQPGMPTEAPAQQDEYGTLELSQFPADAKDQTIQAVVNTFTENMNVQYLTIKAGDKTIADKQGFSGK